MVKVQTLKHLPRAREKEANVRRGAMKKGRSIRVIERQEVIRGDPVECILHTGVISTL